MLNWWMCISHSNCDCQLFNVSWKLHINICEVHDDVILS